MNRISLSLTSLLVVIACSAAQAGERLTIPELLKRTKVAVIVDVVLDRSPSLTLVRSLGPEVVEPSTDPSWIAGCTGSVRHFRRWLHQFSKWSEASLWREGLRRRRYQALLFLDPDPKTGNLRPYCETEAMLMAHTSLHPKFDEYVKSVEAEIARARKDGR